RQPLGRAERRYGDVAKTVEAVRTGDPEAAFAILEEDGRTFDGEAVRLPEHVGSSLVDVDQSAVDSDPQASVAIAKESVGPFLIQRTWQRIRDSALLREASDSAANADQQGSVGVFSESADTVWRICHPIEFRRTRLPAPHAGQCPNPEVALAVLVRAEDGEA